MVAYYGAAAVLADPRIDIDVRVSNPAYLRAALGIGCFQAARAIWDRTARRVEPEKVEAADQVIIGGYCRVCAICDLGWTRLPWPVVGFKPALIERVA